MTSRWGKQERNFAPAFFFLFLVLGGMWGLYFEPHLEVDEDSRRRDAMFLLAVHVPYMLVLGAAIYRFRSGGTFFRLKWPSFIIFTLSGFLSGLLFMLFT